jgi:hypothetical protein
MRYDVRLKQTAVSHAAIHFSADSRQAGKYIPIEGPHMQAGTVDQTIDTPVQIAAATQPVLEGIETVLPSCNGSIVATAMLEEKESPGRFDDSSHFLQGHDGIRNRAEGEGTDDTVECRIVVW